MEHPVKNSFIDTYNKLKPGQKKAVDHVYGPVMVVAGPGTGKTQMLSARVGHILQETDYEAQNILCLTFTEAGAYNMRDRLRSFIGPEAYKVGIYTFHGFCNMVIQENRSYFGGYEDLQPLDDLEELEVIKEVIDDIPLDNPLKRLKGDIYYERRKLLNLFKLMKQENWRTEDLLKAIEQYENEIPELDAFVYQKKFKNKQPGELKRAGYDELDRMKKTRAAVALFPIYEEKLATRKRYDYQDMILWVIRAFEAYPDLLQGYREQYQLLLVDEYQDTNGAQNTVLNLMAGDPDEQPNVFVVGDDDQSIFRFQGASVTNILDFNQRYRDDLTLVLLEENFRSTQKILNVAEHLIYNNKDRLTNRIEGLEKRLRSEASHKDLDEPVNIWSFDNEFAEEVGIYRQIRALLDAGVAPQEIAVIYRNHKHVERLRKKLEIEDVPFTIRRRENVLEHSTIKHIINTLRWIEAERRNPFSADHLLVEIMHYPYFELDALDIGRLAVNLRTRNADKALNWRTAISDADILDEAGLKQPDKVLWLSTFLEGAIQRSASLTVQNLMEFVVDEGKFLRYILEQPDRSALLRILTTLYDFLKERTAKRKSRTLAQFLEDLDNMTDNDLALPVNIEVVRSAGVNLVTAHSAKGLEFDYVFIIGANNNKWEASRAGAHDYRLPPGLTDHQGEDRESEERRLFYVAMTRTRKVLYISYANADMKEKALTASQFVEEISGHPDVQKAEPKLSLAEVDAFTADMLRYNEMVSVELDSETWLEEILKDFKLSPTALNKYIDCPVSFYYENLLRVPRARTSYMGFGSAVHYALEQFFNRRQGSDIFPDATYLVDQFMAGMEHYRSHFTDREYEDLLAYGRQILPAYYEAKLPGWKDLKQSRTEYPVRDAEVEGVPITGKFDRVDVFDREVHVIDYKTGKFNWKSKQKLKGPESDDDGSLLAKLASEQDPKERRKLKNKIYGADYWRQIVFYKILMDANKRDHWRMTMGAVSFVEAVDDYEKDPFRIQVDAEAERVVRSQIRTAYEGIMNKEFNNGCQLEYCQWCSLNQSDMN